MSKGEKREWKITTFALPREMFCDEFVMNIKKDLVKPLYRDIIAFGEK